MSERRTRIVGVGSYLPPRVVTNDDLAQLMDTSDEWIQQRSGIRTRHWVEGETSTSDLALEASREALAMADWQPGDLETWTLGPCATNVFSWLIRETPEQCYPFCADSARG